MYQSIGDQIEVAGVYQQAQFVPKKFKWKSSVYQITATTLIANTKDGGINKRLYSVMSGGNLYRLCFNRDSEAWLLEEIWYE